VKTAGETEITQEYEEEKSSFFDVVSSYATIAAIIGGLITAWVALHNYWRQIDHENLAREKEMFSREREAKAIF
jgi:hypothetical protein